MGKKSQIVISSPEEERKRLEELYQMGLLDYTAEAGLDRLTRIVSEIFQVPICFISLVTEDRQWFKSCVGLPGDLLEARSTEREISFCQHVVSDKSTVVVKDALQDDRFKGSRLVRRYGFRFYGGVPLKTKKGNILGALGIVDLKPRNLAAREKRLLKEFGRWAMAVIDLRFRSTQLLKARENTVAELDRQVGFLQRLNRQLQQELETKRDALEEMDRQMQQKEKLAAMGRIAANINHELRQPLEVVTNAVYYLKSRLARSDIGPAKSDFERFLNIISEECASATRMVNELLQFTRKTTAVPLETDLNPLLDALLAKIEVPDRIKIKRKWKRDLPAISVDPIQIERAVYNLVLNAIQAMPRGGTLSLSTDFTGQTVALTLQDTGIGIAPEEIGKIFDPFFTTKANGTGLGLSMVKQYLQANRARIDVQSRPGEGTTFRITFAPLRKASGPGKKDLSA